MVFNSLGADTHTHTDFTDENFFKKPGAWQPKAGAPGLKITVGHWPFTEQNWSFPQKYSPLFHINNTKWANQLLSTVKHMLMYSAFCPFLILKSGRMGQSGVSHSILGSQYDLCY